MSKMLETKKQILNLLKDRQMTVTELSEKLDLSKSTISQHMDELVSMGAIEKVDNEHFKRLKYYRQVQPMPIQARYIIGAIAVLAVVAVGGFAYLHHPATTVAARNSINTTGNTSAANTNTTVPEIGGTGAMACPMEFYSLNASILGYNGITRYNITSNGTTYADYVMPSGSNGIFSLKETMSNVLQNPQVGSQREHYYTLSPANGTARFSVYVPGMNVTFSPQNFTIENGSVQDFTATLSANATVSGTYWLRVDGPCGGGLEPVLVTVGSAPYAGPVVVGSAIYA